LSNLIQDIRENFENHISNSSKFPLFGLLLIGICGISIRLLFFQPDWIFSSDNLSYFKYAMDVSLTGELPSNIGLPNNGWPLFVSIFFKFFDSGNFLDYMNLQKYLTLILSTVTIIPAYFLSKKFVGSSFALIATLLFTLEPRLIQNSIIGVTEPLFLLLIVTSLTLIFQKNKYIICGAFIAVAFASIVRAEGMFLIPGLCFVFFLRYRINKKTIIQCVIFISITLLIILPFSLQRIESTGNDFLVGRVILSSSAFSEQTQNEPNQIISKIGESIYIFAGFLGRLMIPYLGIFVPIGTILFLRNKKIQKSLLLVPGFFLILPSLYAYTVPALDSKYLFPILPILCIFGALAYKKYFEKIKFKTIFTVIILIIIITSSIIFLDYKKYNTENQKEFLELADIINKNTDIILFVNSPVYSYLDLAHMSELEKFPVTSSDYDKDPTKYVIVDNLNVEEFFVSMKENNITHVVIDEEINNPEILKKIFNNFEKYKELEKVFDSENKGYEHKIKIFKLNFE